MRKVLLCGLATIGGLVIFLIALGLIVGGGDDRQNVANLQRILIAQQLGFERGAITRWNTSPESVRMVIGAGASRLAHVRGWYETRLGGGRVFYQAIVQSADGGRNYRLTCFIVDEKMAAGEAPCF